MTPAGRTVGIRGGLEDLNTLSKNRFIFSILISRCILIVNEEAGAYCSCCHECECVRVCVNLMG